MNKYFYFLTTFFLAANLYARGGTSVGGGLDDQTQNTQSNRFIKGQFGVEKEKFIRAWVEIEGERTESEILTTMQKIEFRSQLTITQIEDGKVFIDQTYWFRSSDEEKKSLVQEILAQLRN